MANQVRGRSLLRSLAKILTGNTEENKSSSISWPDYSVAQAQKILHGAKKIEHGAIPVNYFDAREYARSCISLLNSITSNDAWDFGLSIKSKLIAHKGDWEDIFSRIDKNAPPGWRGEPGNTGGGDGSIRGGSGGGGGGDNGGSSGNEGDSEGDWSNRFRQIISKMSQITSAWISKISEMLGRVVKSSTARALLRESMRILQSAWGWFIDKGVKILLEKIFEWLLGGGGHSSGPFGSTA